MKNALKRICSGLLVAVVIGTLMQSVVVADNNDEEAKFGKRPESISDLEWEKLKAKRPLPFDKGPSTIDVSGYPKELRDIYENVFTKKCAKCHTIARPINAPYALPAEWKKYIKKMMKKPGSAIDPISGKKIYKFLSYDSSVRKKDIIENKLRELLAEKEKKEK